MFPPGVVNSSELTLAESSEFPGVNMTQAEAQQALIENQDREYFDEVYRMRQHVAQRRKKRGSDRASAQLSIGSGIRTTRNSSYKNYNSVGKTRSRLIFTSSQQDPVAAFAHANPLTASVD